MSDRRTWRALHPSTRGVPAPAQDLGQSRSRIVIEPASVPEAAAKPALRHAGLVRRSACCVDPFLRHAPRACEGLRTGLFPAFRLASPRPEGQGSALPLERRRRARDSPRRVYRGEPADLRKPDDRSEGLRPPLRAGRRPRLLAAFPDGKVFQKGAHFPENVILLNMLINKDVGK